MITSMIRYICLITSMFFSIFCYAQSSADYPNKPIHIIVPVAAGGNVDIVARTLGNEMSKILGQSVIIENKPSSASIVGTQYVAKAPPDGYTLLAHSSTFFAAPLISNNAGYDPVKDFAPISLTCKVPMFVMVNPIIQAKNIQEFVQYSKANPGVAVASSGNGSTGHIAAEVFANRAGIKFTNIFYKGNAQAMIDVFSGQVPMMFDQISTGVQNVKSGKLKALAITSLKRSSLMPEIPTMAESGYPGYEDVTLNLLLAPAGTPKEITQKLHAAVVKALNQPELKAKFAERGIDLVTSPSADDLGVLIKSEVSRLQKLAKSAGIKPE
ncbi:MFS transporter [Polynucleobacter sp. SHI2]|nr:MFS transporter [Polynucleobacter sp. SHI2]